MGRWLPKEEREKRDKKIVELYQQGISTQSISARFGQVDIYSTLRRHGIEPSQRIQPPREERDRKDQEIIKLYQSGATYRAIIQSLGLSGASAVTYALARHQIPLRGRQIRGEKE